MERVQLFTITGFLVATVELDAPKGGPLPQAVRYEGHTFILTQGRYLKVDAVAAKAIVTTGA